MGPSCRANDRFGSLHEKNMVAEPEGRGAEFTHRPGCIDVRPFLQQKFQDLNMAMFCRFHHARDAVLQSTNTGRRMTG
jgi:hypothetical protein